MGGKRTEVVVNVVVGVRWAAGPSISQTAGKSTGIPIALQPPLGFAVCILFIYLFLIKNVANIQKIPSSSPVTYSSGLTDEGGKKMLPHLPSPSMSAGPQLWEMKSLSLTGGDAHWENCGELQFQEVIPGKADSCPSPIHHHTYPYIISPQ